MHKRIAIGLIVLIFVLGVAIVFYHQYTDIQQLKKEAAEAEKLLEEKNMPIVENNQQSARPGFKLVPHDDHFHEVPIDAPDTWQGEQHEPVAQPVQVKQPVKPTYTGPLTYHAELLKANPAEALYKQSLERGHWSAKWIPPFPPEDTEAQEFARNLYLREYYESIDDKKNPIYVQAGNEIWFKLDDIHDMPADARSSDLLKLTWARVPAGSVVVDWSDPSNFSLPRTDR